jgi:hypothetical protein
VRCRLSPAQIKSLCFPLHLSSCALSSLCPFNLGLK